MKLKELFDQLKIQMDVGMGEEEVYIVNRFSIPESERANTISTDVIAEVEQELESVEPGDGLEQIYLLGKVDS